MQIQDFSGIRQIEKDTSLPTLTGVAKSEIGVPGGFAEIYVGGVKFTLPLDIDTDRWTWTATEPMPDSEYIVSVRIIVAA